MIGNSLTLDSTRRSNTWINLQQVRGRVVIVFDDFYDYAQATTPPDNSAWSLNSLWLLLSEAYDTLAVGFFDLPVERDHEDLDYMLRAVQEWFQQIRGTVTDCVILVDMNRGASPTWPAGADILAAIQSDACPAFSRGSRIGILSLLASTNQIAMDDRDLKGLNGRIFGKLPPRYGIDKELLTFLREEDLEERLWPSGTDGTREGDYSNWFDSSHPVMKHDYADVRLLSNTERIEANGESVEKKAAAALKLYLHNVLRFSPPEHWLVAPEVDFLWEDLKYFVGSRAIAHVGRVNGRNLTLGNLLLLFGASVGSCAAALLNQIHWTSELSGRQILPSSQTRDQARSVAMILAGKEGLFTGLARHNGTGEFLVREVRLCDNLFTVELGENFRAQWKGSGRSLLDQVLEPGPENGVVYTAFKQFLTASAVSREGRQAMCVLNLLADEDPEKHASWLEFRRCW